MRELIICLRITVITLLLIWVQGCARPQLKEMSYDEGWFKNATYTYNLGTPAHMTARKKRPIPPQMQLVIEDFDGFYDWSAKQYQLNPGTGKGAIPMDYFLNDLGRNLESAIKKIKFKKKLKRNGYLYFGGFSFSRYLMDFYFSGEIEDPQSAFGFMNSAESALVTMNQFDWQVDAPVPYWPRKSNWTVTVIYAGKAVETNASEHDIVNRKLIWSSQNTTDQRIRFTITAPGDGI